MTDAVPVAHPCSLCGHALVMLELPDPVGVRRRIVHAAPQREAACHLRPALEA